MDSSLEFAASVRALVETLGLLVRASFQRGLTHDAEWPEEHFFKTLVDDGLRGGHPHVKRLLDRISDGGRYSLRFDTVRHNPQKTEPLTGADLALVVQLDVDNRTLTRRVMLVQLKKAELVNGRIRFSELHRTGGKKWFGRNLHQAERMLLFTQCAVYWLAVVPNPTADREFFKRYVSRTNLAERAQRRFKEQLVASAGPPDGVWPLALWLHGFLPVSPPLKKNTPSWYKLLVQEETDRALRTLWADLAVESERLHGMRSRLSVLVTHAESVLQLRPRREELSSVYPLSVSLPEFILQEVLTEGFGDENEELIDALMTPKPADYVKRIVQEYAAVARIPGLDEADAVRAVIRAQLSVRTPAFRQG
jgi:hypothetical protein